jgi:hypothetical protein
MPIPTRPQVMKQAEDANQPATAREASEPPHARSLSLTAKDRRDAIAAPWEWPVKVVSVTSGLLSRADRTPAIFGLGRGGSVQSEAAIVSVVG